MKKLLPLSIIFCCLAFLAVVAQEGAATQTNNQNAGNKNANNTNARRKNSNGNNSNDNNARENENGNARRSAEKTRKYERGPKGGCFYLNPNGKKIYVKREKCEASPQ
jgi:Ni/Co efflux regulator RcnB